MSGNVISLANLKDALQKASVGNRLAIDIDGKRRVICQVLDVEEEEHLSPEEDDMIEELLKNPLQIKGFKPLTREEAHERK